MLKTVASRGTGVPALVDALERFHSHLEKSGLRDKRLRGMIESELIEAAFSDFYNEAVPRLKNQKEWDGLVNKVAKRELDPETAAAKLVKIISTLEA